MYISMDVVVVVVAVAVARAVFCTSSSKKFFCTLATAVILLYTSSW